MKKLLHIDYAKKHKSWIFIFIFLYFLISNIILSQYSLNDLFTVDYFYQQQKSLLFSFGDSDAYLKFAFSFIESGDFMNPIGEKSAWVTPGYPLFLAFIFVFFGSSPLTVLVAQSLLYTISTILLYTTILQIKNVRIANLFFLLALINLNIITYIGKVYTEILFFTIISVIIYFLYRKPKKLYILTVLGFAIGYAILTRPVFVPVLFILALYFKYFFGKFRNFLFVVILALIPLSIWITRNYLIFERVTVSTSSEVSSLPISNYEGYSFKFFKPYFISNELLPMDERISLLSEKGVEYPNIENGNDSLIWLTQGYGWENKAQYFTNIASEIRNKNFTSFVLKSIYLFKTVMSPYIGSMSLRNKVFSTIIYLLTFLPWIIGLFIYRDMDYYFYSLFALLLLLLPSLVIIDPNLRYQLPAQFVMMIPAAIVLNGFFEKVLSLYKNKRL